MLSYVKLLVFYCRFKSLIVIFFDKMLIICDELAFFSKNVCLILSLFFLNLLLKVSIESDLFK